MSTASVTTLPPRPLAPTTSCGLKVSDSPLSSILRNRLSAFGEVMKDLAMFTDGYWRHLMLPSEEIVCVSCSPALGSARHPCRSKLQRLTSCALSLVFKIRISAQAWDLMTWSFRPSLPAYLRWSPASCSLDRGDVQFATQVSC